MTDVPVDPALIAQHAVHRHVWKPPARTHGGWFVACEDETCAAWWASPGPKVPTEVPGSVIPLSALSDPCGGDRMVWSDGWIGSQHPAHPSDDQEGRA